MGYAYCGKDARGRRIGYAISAKCDFKGCKTRIDRGMGYACGGDHGEEFCQADPWDNYCDGYFCSEHGDKRIHNCPALENQSR